MLGEKILDPLGVEGAPSEVSGLSLLPVVTIFEETKETTQVEAIHLESGVMLKGYEIHMGRTRQTNATDPVFRITKCQGAVVSREDGNLVRSGQIWGTYLHGLFESTEFCAYFLNSLREKKGLQTHVSQLVSNKSDAMYDQLAHLIRAHLDTDRLYELIGLASSEHV